MKKILLLHNEYKEKGGEDIAVDSEIRLLESKYNLKVLKFNNSIEKPYQQFISFLTLSNNQSNKLVKENIESFSPDVIYIHNTWFKISLGIFKLLNSYKIPVFIKLHNFRYNCTKSFFFKNHIDSNDFCPACGIKNKRRIFNKYFPNSYLKSFAIINYGIKFFKIIKSCQFKLIVLTEFHKEYLEYLKIPKEIVNVYPNYLDVDLSKQELKNEEKYLIYAGRISAEKGVEELIKSFLDAQLLGFELKIVGDGPLRKDLMKIYKQGNINFLGYQDNKKVLELISSSNGVITGTKLYEGQPTLLCEASLLGVPSIFPKNGGISEFFPNDYEYSYDMDIKNDLTNKLIKFYENINQNKDIGNVNKKFVTKKLEKNKLISKFENIVGI